MKKIFSLILTFVFLMGAMIIPANAAYGSTDVLAEVHYIDVGQGDAIYIKYNSYDILIDAGDNTMGTRVVNYLTGKVSGNIELVIATHPDSDHIGGMDTVLNSFTADRIIDSGVTSTTVTYNDYKNAVNAQVSRGAIYSGDSDLTFNIDTNVKLEVIETGDNNGSNNENSVLSRLVYGNVEYLFTGDMGETTEPKVLTKPIQADILKVGHHGSRYSSTADFLAAVAPKVSVICVGANNTYGHPTQETLDRLTAVGSDIYMTKDAGNIIVKTNGTIYDVNGVEYTGTGGSSGGGGTTPPPPVSTGVIIESIDAVNEKAVIKNTTTSSVNMTGWKLVSVSGNQTYFFPDNFTLGAGQTVTVTAGPKASGNGTTTLKWTTSYIWANTGDPGELYNANGQLVSEFGK